MLKVKILGPGCPNCEKVEQHARQAIEIWRTKHPGEEVEIEKVTDLDRITDYGVLSTPGVVVNEELFSSGQIPTIDQIHSWLVAMASV